MNEFALKDIVLVVDPDSYGYGLRGKVVKTDFNNIRGETVYRIKFENRHMNLVWLSAKRLMKYT